MLHTNNNKANPIPEALLVEAKREQGNKGRLKIFLGAAPGVGKTYAMLQSAQQRCQEGCNVLVGLIETHGRKETEALLKGLKIASRKKIIYRSKEFGEVDIQSIIKEKPQLVLIDELAHTNIPGSHHDKRYLDVLELLNAGIDVYTTMNIQHIESLNDNIQQITKIRVQETVPDSIFENADTIVLVDLTAEELIQRLKEGKVYVPHMAERAIKHFFSPNNINALRELALRTAAKNIGQSIFTYKQAHGIEVPWSVAERIMVCISDSEVTPRLIRTAKNMTSRKDAKLIALHVETTAEENLRDEQKKRLSNNMRLAKAMGAELVVLTSHNVADAILDYAAKNNVTDIFMGKSIRFKFLDILSGSISNEVIRRSGNMTTHILSEKTGRQKGTRLKIELSPRRGIRISDYVMSLVLIGIVCLLTIGFTQYFSSASSSMLFLLVIMFSAYRWGLYPALFTAIVTFIIYIYAYTTPTFVFQIAKLQEGLASIVFVLIAIVISQLTARVSQQAQKARERELMTRTIYGFIEHLGKALDIRELLDIIGEQIAQTVNVQTLIFLPEQGKLELKLCHPYTGALDKKITAAAKWAWEHKQVCGMGTGTLSGMDWYYVPLLVAKDVIGVIAVKAESPEDFFAPINQDFFYSLIDQAAFAIAHMQLLTEKKS